MQREKPHVTEHPDRADRWRAAVRPSEVSKARVEDGIGRARHRYSRNLQGVRAFEVTNVHIESRENTPIARGRALPREDGRAIF